MPSGLFALLDDVAVIAKLAAASIDDIGAAAAKAGTKAAGVVVDDTAVTPKYLTGFTPDRELPVIWRIAKGSLRNKLFFILPVALLLSVFLPMAITPILMLGGTYLCFEGAEKIIHALSPHGHDLSEQAEELGSADHEEKMAVGAIRTDFILSAEIMAIALGQVSDQPFLLQATALIIVAIAITMGVYGAVALIVKLDDIGLHMAQRDAAFAQFIGRGLVHAMPKILGGLTIIGTAAMLWVGGQIILHALEEFGLNSAPHFIHHLAETASASIPMAATVTYWLVGAIGAGIFGLILGTLVVATGKLVSKIRR